MNELSPDEKVLQPELLPFTAAQLSEHFAPLRHRRAVTGVCVVR